MSDDAEPKGTTYHDEHVLDRAAMLAMRAMLKVQKAPPLGPEGRPASDTMMSNIVAAEGVDYAPAVIGGVQGWWCSPSSARPDAAILHFHGGAYVVGSAWAYRHFIGQVAQRACVRAFIPDYALAPGRPFPAGPDDAIAVFDALAKTHTAIAITGDSAGGGIALGLLNSVTNRSDETPSAIRCGVLLSPWLDLSLSGDSVKSQASADPLLSRDALAAAADHYLGDTDPRDPRASPLFAASGGLPPMMVHVGEDEVLRDDSLRLARLVADHGGRIEAHVWKGMFHVLPAGFTTIRAGAEAMDLIGAFVRSHLQLQAR